MRLVAVDHGKTLHPFLLYIAYLGEGEICVGALYSCEPVLSVALVHFQAINIPRASWSEFPLVSCLFANTGQAVVPGVEGRSKKYYTPPHYAILLKNKQEVLCSIPLRKSAKQFKTNLRQVWNV